MALPDFFLFLHLKEPIKGRYFGAPGEIQEARIAALKTVPEKTYRDAFNAWKSR